MAKRKYKRKKRKITTLLLYPFKSQLEKRIYEQIFKHFPNEKIKINQKGLIKNRKRLELDLYLPQYNIGIEIQGPVHTQNEKNIFNDYEKKKLFLNENNIRIIYIYTNNYQVQKDSLQKCINIINNKKRNCENNNNNG